MLETPPSKTRPGGGFALAGAALAMGVCCGLPLLIVLVSSLAIGTLLGVGGGILAAVALVAIVVARIRARRCVCAPRTPDRRPMLRPRP